MGEIRHLGKPKLLRETVVIINHQYSLQDRDTSVRDANVRTHIGRGHFVMAVSKVIISKKVFRRTCGQKISSRKRRTGGN
jgi:hypothetical protein